MTSKRIVFSSCSHEVKDVSWGYRSLHQAIVDHTAAGWDIWLDHGDHDAGQQPPGDAEGQIVLNEFASMTPAQRASVYSISGNHDRSGPYEPPAWWWRKYVDPMGENTAISGMDPALRPYTVVGTWERYYFDMGNIRFLMMSDVNRPTTAARGIRGGDPGGVISEETWEWFKDQVLSNPDKILIVCHHYLPRETTSATGDYEGCRWDADTSGPNPRIGRYSGWIHGAGLDAKHASRLSYIGDKAAPEIIEGFLAAHPGYIALWTGAHSHLKPGPDGAVGSKTLVEEKYGITFANVGSLTQHHGVNGHLYPRSRLLEVNSGQQTAQMHSYFHTHTDFSDKGWWPGVRQVDLGKPVEL